MNPEPTPPRIMNPENEIPTPTKYPRSEALDSACTHMNDAEKHGILQVGIRALEQELSAARAENARLIEALEAYEEWRKSTVSDSSNDSTDKFNQRVHLLSKATALTEEALAVGKEGS